jgi:protein-tyrosine-phosphatase
MHSIVFVCTGNVCRSAMAEGMLRERLSHEGKKDITVSSMGIHGLDKEPASQIAQLVCKEHGVDISSHKSRSLVGSELVDADLILTMDLVQRDFVRLFFPQVADCTFLFGSWPDEGGKKQCVPDPIGKPISAYRKVHAMIEKRLDEVWEDLMAFLGE